MILPQLTQLHKAADVIDCNIREAERFCLGHPTVADVLNVVQHLCAHLLIGLFAAHDGAEVNVHVVLHVLISTSICRDFQDGDDGIAGAGAAARGEDDCVAAGSDHRGDRGNIIASGVHNDCAALRGRNRLFQNFHDGTGAALADAAEALFVQRGHGLTAYNAEKRYQGQRDIPLCPAGRAQLRQADLRPETVYITPLCRTRQTAEVLFPGARLVEVKDLQEMCFGSFEGRNFIEMEHDPDYLAWVNANCESPCPDGETKAVFSERVCRAFAALVDKALADGEETLVILAHGGTQMAAMERYALPHADYYHWCAPNAGGYVLDAGDWAEQRVLHLLKTVQYTKEDAR